MDKTKDEKTQITAHQAWVQLMAQLIRPILYSDRVIAGRNWFQTSKKEVLGACNNALSVLEYFETMRLRIYIDALIVLGEATTTRRNEIHVEHAATHWIRFRKRRQLIRQDADQLVLQEAYKRAIGILSNTMPPVIETQPVEQKINGAQMHVSVKREVCEECEGTGYVGVMPKDSAGQLCPFCNGTGSQPQREEGGDSGNG